MDKKQAYPPPLATRPDARATVLMKQCQRFLNNDPMQAWPDVYRELADYCEKHRIGSDYYGHGEFLNAFEEEVAVLLGYEAAVFLPSGTMAQPIALRIWCDQAGSKKVAFHPTSHLELNEFHAYRELHQLEATLVGDPDRCVYAEDLEKLDLACTLIELPQRRTGGTLPTWEELDRLKKTARAKGMKLHLDGARLWECQPFYGRSLREICAGFDSTYVSFYKGLNALTGAMLLGSEDFIAEARTWIRRQGGNLYQLHPYVVSSKMMFDRNRDRFPRLAEKTKAIGEALKRAVPGVIVQPDPPQATMLQAHFPVSGDRYQQFRLDVAQREKIWLSGLSGESTLLPGGSAIEIHVGSAALEISEEEIERIFRSLKG